MSEFIVPCSKHLLLLVQTELTTDVNWLSRETVTPVTMGQSIRCPQVQEGFVAKDSKEIRPPGSAASVPS